MCLCLLLGLSLVLLTLEISSVSGFLSECEVPVCGKAEVPLVSSRIVGGQKARPGSLPWMAMLVWCNYLKCGGAILNDQFILTAAHCFDEPKFPCYALDSAASSSVRRPDSWTVYLGKHSVLRSNEGERQMEVERVLLHPHYDNHTQKNDVALLKLKDRVFYSSLIKPLCLPSSPVTVPRPGQGCIVAGYGQTLTVDTHSLHQVTVPVLSDEQCSQPDWYGDSFFPPDQLCAGFETGGMDACLGDSGSPLICNFDGVWYANGVVSRGLGCAQPKKPGVYSNMSFHQSWIKHTIGQYGSPPTLCP